MTFRPDNALDAVTPIPVAALRTLARHGFRLPATLANNGTPSHPAIRAAVADALHPDRVGAQRAWLTGMVRRRVLRLAAKLRAGEPVDLYADLAADLPLLVLARLVALPELRRGCGQGVLPRRAGAVLGPGGSRSPAGTGGRGGPLPPGTAPVRAYRPGLVARLRADGHRGRGGRCALFLLVAGQETTSQFLTLLLHRLAGCRRSSPIWSTGAYRSRTWSRKGYGGTRRSSPGAGSSVGTPSWTASRAGRHPADPLAGQGESRPGVVLGARLVPAWAARSRAGTSRSAPAPTAASALNCPEWRLRWWWRRAPLLRGVEVVRSPACPDNLSFRMPDALTRQKTRSPSELVLVLDE